MRTPPLLTSFLSKFTVLAIQGLLLGSNVLAETAPAGPKAAAVQDGTDFVDLAVHIPGLRIHLPYATSDNFLKTPVYTSNRAFLRRTVADRLAKVQADLAVQGLALEILDAYRPLSIQRQMWAILPDSRYVADPAKGSRHNRGAAVDVTLVDRAGTKLEMPTVFDDFSEKAHVSSPASPAATRNRAVLQAAMTKQGFVPLQTEWWHFDAPDWMQYPVLDLSISQLETGALAVPVQTTVSTTPSAGLEQRVLALEKEVQVLRRQITELESKLDGRNAKPAVELRGQPLGN